jgi:iron complex outermembrane recepter protein
MVSRPLPALCAGLCALLGVAQTAESRPQSPSSAPSQSRSSSSGQPPIIVKEEVQVVATIVPQPPHEVPASIEVITGNDMRNVGAKTLREALALAAGVEIAAGGDGGPASSVPEFWGLREFDAFLLVVDNVPWGGTFNPALTSLSLHDVERIEILRGPAPVTFGATSFVGVIHVVHNPAATNTRYATFDAGTRTSGSANVDIAIPTGPEWQSRLTAGFERQGFKDPRTLYDRSHVLWRTAKTQGDSRTWFSADLNLLRQDPASPHPRQGAGLSPNVPLDANYNPDGAFLNENRIALNFGLERPLQGSRRFGTIVSYTQAGQDLFRGFLSSISDTPRNANGLRQTIDQRDLYVDSYMMWPERHHVQFTVGGDYLHGNGDTKGATFPYTVPLGGEPATVVAEPTNLNLASEDRREFFGAYTLAEWKPTTRLRVSGGLRLNVTFEEGGEGENAATRPANEQDESQTNVRPSGSIGAILGLWEKGANHIRVFGDYRNTFKPAAFDFGLGQGEVEGGLLAPETAQTFEGGLKARALDGRFDFEASVFRMDFNNLVSSTVVNGLPALQNTGKTRFTGFELAADARMRHAVTGRATYSYHDARFVDFVQAFDGVPTQLGGNRIEMSANHLCSAGLVLAPDKGVVASVIAKFTGDRYLNKRNTALAPGFTTLDIGAGYRFSGFDVRFDARNITDVRDPVSESELGDAQYYRMVAREAKVTLGMRF